MMHGAPSTPSYSLHCTQHNYTTYTSDTMLTMHAYNTFATAQNKQLKAISIKTGSHEFPEFLLEKFGIS
jgi:hypothetical protein